MRALFSSWLIRLLLYQIGRSPAACAEVGILSPGAEQSSPWLPVRPACADTLLARMRDALGGHGRLEGGVRRVDGEAGAADHDLAWRIAGGWANKGDVFCETGEERGDRIRFGSTQRLPVEQAQDLRPGTPGGTLIRLRAITE